MYSSRFWKAKYTIKKVTRHDIPLCLFPFMIPMNNKQKINSYLINTVSTACIAFVNRLYINLSNSEYKVDVYGYELAVNVTENRRNTII